MVQIANTKHNLNFLTLKSVSPFIFSFVKKSEVLEKRFHLFALAQCEEKKIYLKFLDNAYTLRTNKIEQNRTSYLQKMLFFLIFIVTRKTKQVKLSKRTRTRQKTKRKAKLAVKNQKIVYV